MLLAGHLGDAAEDVRGVGQARLDVAARTVGRPPWNSRRDRLGEADDKSIGCAPCTTPVAPGEDERAGRWRGSEKVECGIHFGADGRILRAAS